MKKWIIANKLHLSGAAIGALAGYIYYAKVGCISGTCAITSNPINSTIYFAVLGALVFGLFKKAPLKSDKAISEINSPN